MTHASAPDASLRAHSDDASDPFASARRAAGRLAALTGAATHDAAVVMGSGWVPAADALGAPDHEGDVTDLPGFPAPAVAGHSGRFRSVRVGDKRVLVLLGRTHLYEGRGVAPTVHAVRTAAAAGCSTMVLTNGCGAIAPEYRPGQAVLLRDHLNLTCASPVRGAGFVDVTDLYTPRLRALGREIEPSLREGVYVQLPGPHYETPAEVRMLRAMGGDLVGMSTALEAIAAREAGMEVLGLSLVTNMAAGTTGAPLEHREVLETGRDSAARTGELLAHVLRRL
ncbi:purine-nucleoside phosphorylase [Streptomyces sp. PU-14G]|uniref:purine-nucleoside phosphorylase n=1 Tax=Streptomyces sp. PU-14G TaxID=2800808 RepID=UPI0034DFC9DC